MPTGWTAFWNSYGYITRCESGKTIQADARLKADLPPGHNSTAAAAGTKKEPQEHRLQVQENNSREVWPLDKAIVHHMFRDDAIFGLGLAYLHLNERLYVEEASRSLGKLFENASSEIVGLSLQGSGLGLPLAKAFVELHGGNLELSSILGKGTTVTMYYPISAQAT